MSETVSLCMSQDYRADVLKDKVLFLKEKNKQLMETIEHLKDESAEEKKREEELKEQLRLLQMQEDVSSAAEESHTVDELIERLREIAEENRRMEQLIEQAEEEFQDNQSQVKIAEAEAEAENRSSHLSDPLTEGQEEKEGEAEEQPAPEPEVSEYEDEEEEEYPEEESALEEREEIGEQEELTEEEDIQRKAEMAQRVQSYYNDDAREGAKAVGLKQTYFDGIAASLVRCNHRKKTMLSKAIRVAETPYNRKMEELAKAYDEVLFLLARNNREEKKELVERAIPVAQSIRDNIKDLSRDTTEKLYWRYKMNGAAALAEAHLQAKSQRPQSGIGAVTEPVVLSRLQAAQASYLEGFNQVFEIVDEDSGNVFRDDLKWRNGIFLPVTEKVAPDADFVYIPMTTLQEFPELEKHLKHPERFRIVLDEDNYHVRLHFPPKFKPRKKKPSKKAAKPVEEEKKKTVETEVVEAELKEEGKVEETEEAPEHQNEETAEEGAAEAEPIDKGEEEDNEEAQEPHDAEVPEEGAAEAEPIDKGEEEDNEEAQEPHDAEVPEEGAAEAELKEEGKVEETEEAPEHQNEETAEEGAAEAEPIDKGEEEDNEEAQEPHDAEVPEEGAAEKEQSKGADEEAEEPLIEEAPPRPYPFVLLLRRRCLMFATKYYFDEGIVRDDVFDIRALPNGAASIENKERSKITPVVKLQSQNEEDEEAEFTDNLSKLEVFFGMGPAARDLIQFVRHFLHPAKTEGEVSDTEEMEASDYEEDLSEGALFDDGKDYKVGTILVRQPGGDNGVSSEKVRHYVYAARAHDMRPYYLTATQNRIYVVDKTRVEYFPDGEEPEELRRLMAGEPIEEEEEEPEEEETEIIEDRTLPYTFSKGTERTDTGVPDPKVGTIEVPITNARDSKKELRDVYWSEKCYEEPYYFTNTGNRIFLIDHKKINFTNQAPERKHRSRR
eukprot:gene6292-4528_t